MPIVTVIYDTSYLMNKGSIHEPNYKISYQSFKDLDRGANWDDQVARRLISFQHVIPTEVKQEIFRHLASDEKASAARTARAMCAQIMARKDYQEISLADIAISPNQEVFLGPDSKTDKGIIALARRFVSASEPGLVYVATDDGGIQAELSILYSQVGLPVYSRASESEYQRAFDDLFVPLMQQAVKDRVTPPPPPSPPRPKSFFARLFSNDRNA